MLLVADVDLHLVRAVGGEVTGIAFELHRVQGSEEPELPLISNASLFDVVDMAEPLEMLVSLAMQLEVGLQLCSVVAKLTEVIAPKNN